MSTLASSRVSASARNGEPFGLGQPPLILVKGEKVLCLDHESRRHVHDVKAPMPPRHCVGRGETQRFVEDCGQIARVPNDSSGGLIVLKIRPECRGLPGRDRSAPLREPQGVGQLELVERRDDERPPLGGQPRHKP